MFYFGLIVIKIQLRPTLSTECITEINTFKHNCIVFSTGVIRLLKVQTETVHQCALVCPECAYTCAGSEAVG